jgi:hypothetical protein
VRGESRLTPRALVERRDGRRRFGLVVCFAVDRVDRSVRRDVDDELGIDQLEAFLRRAKPDVPSAERVHELSVDAEVFRTHAIVGSDVGKATGEVSGLQGAAGHRAKAPVMTSAFPRASNQPLESPELEPVPAGSPAKGRAISPATARAPTGCEAFERVVRMGARHRNPE